MSVHRTKKLHVRFTSVGSDISYFHKEVSMRLKVNLDFTSVVSGICQRHNDMFYNFIGENRDEIISDVQCFFYHVIKDNFPDKSCEYIYEGRLITLRNYFITEI